MASWPTVDRLDDKSLALSLRGGDADALTQIYDTYAPWLYEYCHALLRDQTTAAYALHDSLIAATEHVGRLREPERLRSWLYALVRAECMRLRDDPDRPADGYEAPEVEDPLINEADRIQREDTRQLVHSALSGLTGRQREALDLTVRHELTTEELAAVLGVTTRQSAELARQARSHLGKMVGAAMTARSLHDECPSLAALTDTWPLGAEASSKLLRHVENCPTCSEHRPREVSINRLLQVLPVAAAPEDLRTQVLTTATTPEQREDRLALADRAEPLDTAGWPVAAEATRAPQRTGRAPVRAWPIAAAAAAVVVIVGAVMLLMPSGSEEKEPGSSTAALPSEPGDEPSNVPPLESGLPETPAPTTSSARTPTPTPTPTRATPTPTPSRTRATRPPAAPPPPQRGELSVSGCNMGSRSTCSITLRATGGPVNWRVTGVSGPVRASGSGTLQAGETTGVTVGRSSGCPLFGTRSGTVSFSPGGSANVSYC
ncbi:sigma-70 family RNA polymerase sigma factor [Actinomadura alba]|uniref:RNA polymerase sigma factor n=1 Tax=Actinomadura alba TaxID=406431 RepID=UPI0031D97713